MHRSLSGFVFLLVFGAACTTVEANESLVVPLSAKTDNAFQGYLDDRRRPNFKAFVVQVGSDYWASVWGQTTPALAVEHAQETCLRKGHLCRVYALGNMIVLGQDEVELTYAMAEYYRMVLQPADPVTIRATALNDDGIRALLAGKKGRGLSVLTGVQFGVEYGPTGQLWLQFLGFAVGKRQGDHGEWWAENGHACSRFTWLRKGHAECLLIVAEGDGFSAYADDGVLRTRVRFGRAGE